MCQDIIVEKGKGMEVVGLYGNVSQNARITKHRGGRFSERLEIMPKASRNLASKRLGVRAPWVLFVRIFTLGE